MTPLFFIAAALYATAAVAYLVYLFGRRGLVLRVARWTLVAALAAHLGMIGLLCTQKLNPLRDLRGALSFSAWLLAAGYLVTTWRTRMGALGALIAPLSLALLVIARAAPQEFPAGTPEAGMLGKIHIALASLGVAAFGLAAGIAFIYLVQERALKRKRLGAFNRKSPPLETLDRFGRRLILLGFPLYTLAMITGAVWVARLPDVGALRIEHLISIITWVVFGGLILARVTVGWRGRRAAWMTVVGFLALLVILLLYLARRLGAG